ncbi:MAG: hypothetical protein JXQ73_33305 [Phycisphaerae bacterium]|nr:hypothetical protein [Phycisphaerae bacterium]
MEHIRLTFQRDFRGDLVLVAVGAIVLALAGRVIALAVQDRQIGKTAAWLTAGSIGVLCLVVGVIVGVAIGASAGFLAFGAIVVNATVLWAWAVLLIWRRSDLPSFMSMGLALLIVAGMDAAAFAGQLRQPGVMAPVVVILCVATVVVFYHVVYRFLGAARVTTLLVLRCLAILVLLMLLFRPVLAVIPTGGKSPMVLMLVDASKSMSVQDTKNAPSRYESAVETCSAEMPTPAKRFDVRYYVFDSSLRAAEGLDDLLQRQPEGEATNLVLALTEGLARHPNQEIFAVCLLTDGNHNGPGDPVATAKSLGVPLYTVGVGTEEMRSDRVQDISIAAVDAPDEVVANNVSKIKAHIADEGLANRSIEVLLKDGPQQLDKQTLVLSNDRKIQVVELSYKPTTTGRKRLTVSVPVDPAELISENNSHDVHLLVTDPQIKVLYIEGAVRPEFKFLRRFLGTDPNLELATLVLVRPPTFTAGGTVGGKPLSGFPRTAEEFKAFDVFIIGDLDRSYLSTEQMEFLAEAVRSGKGLLMIGGTATLGPGGYGGTVVEQALPVAVGPRSRDRQETMPFLPRLTAEGKIHPIFEGLTEYFAPSAQGGATTTQAGGALPLLQGCVIVDGPKAGAAILAEHPLRQRAGKPLIVLAVQSFGSGRAAVFTADTTWRWYMFRRALGMQSPYHRFWGQFVRWLASSELKERSTESGVQVQVAKGFYHPGQRVEILAKVRDEEGQACDFANVVAGVKLPDGTVKEFTLARRQEQVGVYEAVFEPSLPGEHEIEVTARKQDRVLGKDAISFTLGRPSAEFEKLSLDGDRLAKMAGAAGGEYVKLPGLSDLMARLVRRYETRGLGARQPTEYAIFTASTDFRKHLKMAIVFGVFIVLITSEWLLRRYWQLG